MSVIVPATDRPPGLGRCIDAIRRSSMPPEELIVVTDPPDSGPAAARNRGLERCRAEIACFVDSDVEVHPDALELLRARLRADPGLVAVFGSYDDQPCAPGLVSRFRNLLHHSVHQRAAGPVASFWAGLGAVRLDAVRAVGGFDERLFPTPAVEDVELGFRLHAAGGRIELDPAILGTHRKRWSLPAMVVTDIGARAMPWTRLILAGRGPRTGLNLDPRELLATSVSALLLAAAVLRRPREMLAALLALAVLELPLLGLLARRGGPPLLAAGIPLLVLHHASAIAGGLLGAAGHYRPTGRRP